MNKYIINLNIALYPKGISGISLIEEANELSTCFEFQRNYDNFDKYLCTKEQAKYVLNYLSKFYAEECCDEYGITDLQIGENDGEFICKAYLLSIDDNPIDFDSAQDNIREMIWPADIHEDCRIVIGKNMYTIDIEIDNIDDDEDEEEYVNDDDEDEDDKNDDKDDTQENNI